jgi:hypothetical protein
MYSASASYSGLPVEQLFGEIKKLEVVLDQSDDEQNEGSTKKRTKGISPTAKGIINTINSMPISTLQSILKKRLLKCSTFLSKELVR